MDAIAREFSELIKTSLKDRLKKIILYGSRARGDFTEGSDCDFLIVVDKRDEEVRERILRIEVEMLDKYNTLFASIVCDEKEWEKESRFPLGINIDREGIALWMK